jgi:hypothetical protein
MSPVFAQSRSVERAYHPFRGRRLRVVHIHIFLLTRRNVWPRPRRNRRSPGQAVDRRPGASGQKSDSGPSTRTRPGLRIAIATKMVGKPIMTSGYVTANFAIKAGGAASTSNEKIRRWVALSGFTRTPTWLTCGATCLSMPSNFARRIANDFISILRV